MTRSGIQLTFVTNLLERSSSLCLASNSWSERTRVGRKRGGRGRGREEGGGEREEGRGRRGKERKEGERGRRGKRGGKR